MRLFAQMAFGCSLSKAVSIIMHLPQTVAEMDLICPAIENEDKQDTQDKQDNRN